ncbi:hypothetical protein D3C78_696310 [compost metagenome]
MIREALLEMGKGHLIGNGPDCLVPPEGRGEAKAERSRSKGLKPALTRHSNIVHQRGNGADSKTAGGKAGNGKPVGSQLSKGPGNGKPAAQGAAQGKPAGKPAHKGKAPTRAGSAKPGAKPATQGGKPAVKGNGAKRPAR